LPRWHAKLRKKEYDAINARLGRPQVQFVPDTKIGRDIEFPALVGDWGFTAVLLAVGAWRDRPLAIAGADAYVGRGLIYQNAFIYWFNHYAEKGYAGPRYEPVDGAIVVGGGLASIDVVKVLQIETVRRALATRGITEDVLRLEYDGIRPVLEAHDLTWESLGLEGATLFYRRRIEDMPLVPMPSGADVTRREKVQSTRRRILEKAMRKYLFRVRPEMVPVGLVVQGASLAGLRFQRTRIEEGRAVGIPDAFEDVRAPLVVSSIGSVPEPMRGIPQDGALYRFADHELGRLEGYDTVFSVGNVVTGKGNILDSRAHSIEVTGQLVECFLGVAEADHAGEQALLDLKLSDADQTAVAMATWLENRPPLSGVEITRLLERVRERQRAVGYEGDYCSWITRVTPPNLA